MSVTNTITPELDKIVSLVLDNKFNTQSLWYPIGILIEREEAKPLEEPEKELKSVMTELVVYEFLSTTSQICKFISTVYNTFNEVLQLYNRRTQHSDDDIFFIYKGGNILRFVSNKVFYMLPGKVKDDLIKYYRDSFKKSDADFSIYINPKLVDFERVFNDLTVISYLTLNYLRNLFISNPNEYFNYYNLTEQSKQELLQKYLNKLNNTEVIKNQILKGTYYSLGLPNVRYVAEKNVQSGTSILPMENQDVGYYPNKKYNPKFDFEMVFDKKANILYSGDPNDPDKLSRTVIHALRPLHLEQFSDSKMENMAKKQLEIYGNISQSEFMVSINRTTTFLAAGGLVSFNLLRTKVSFNAEKIIDNQSFLDKIDGELIDISITNRGDYSVDSFFEKRNEYIAEYTLEEDGCTVPFRAYSIDYLIHDLENILFVQFAYPWNDVKYAKRLKRLLFMYYLSLFTNIFTTNNERMIYLQELMKNVLLPAKEYPTVNRETIISGINIFSDKFHKYDHVLNIKNMIQRISDLIMDDRLDLEKFHEFINSIIDNIDVLYKSLVDFNEYLSTSGTIEEEKIYEGQLGGKYYRYKMRKYKNKFHKLKEKGVRYNTLI